jgi:hypothetical protein
MMGKSPQARTIWLVLMALSLVSTFLAEGSGHARFAMVAIFVIAAAKGDLVIMHYMEVVTALLIGGHVLAG